MERRGCAGCTHVSVAVSGSPADSRAPKATSALSARPEGRLRWGSAHHSLVDHLVNGGLLVPRARHDVLVVCGDVAAQDRGGFLGLAGTERRRAVRFQAAGGVHIGAC